MTDLSSLSNEQLLSIAGISSGGAPAAQESNPLANISNEDLLKIVNQEQPSFLEKRWQNFKDLPSMLWNVAKEIPSGVQNLQDLPKNIAGVGLDTGNIASHYLFGTPIQGSGLADYGQLDRTFKGIGSLASQVAGGAVAGPPGIAAANKGYEWLLNLTGDPNTPMKTPEQDAEDLWRDTTQMAVLGAAAKGLEKGASYISEKAPEVANALDRKSIGTMKSDYGGKTTTRTIETPEGDIQTFVKSQLDDLLENGKLGTSRDPSTMLQVIEDKSTGLTNEINSKIDAWDRANPETVPVVEFTNAEKFLSADKVKSTELKKYQQALDDVKNTLAQGGDGTLRYLQEQKKAYGDSYNLLDKTASNFDRAVYRDLKKAVEKYVPEVEGLNKELAKYITVEPIVTRALRGQESSSPLTKLEILKNTTGGVGAPAILGTLLGGPAGAVIGGALGLTSKAAASPKGQALIARGIRALGSSSAEAATGINSALTPSIFKKGGGGGGSPPSAIGEVFAKEPATLTEGAANDLYRGARGQAPLEAQLAAEDLSAGETLRPSNVTSTGETSRPSGAVALTTPSTTATENLSPSYKYSPSTSVNDILGNSGFISHYKFTTKQLPELQNILKQIAEGNPIKSNVKSVETAAAKILRKRAKTPGYDEKSLGDLIRGNVVAPDNRSAIRILNKLKETAPIVGEVENYIKSPTSWGYQGINANIRTPSGALAEVQIHTPTSLAIQEAIHPVYEKYRNIKNPTPEQMQNILDESRVLAAKALLKVHNASKKASAKKQSGINSVFSKESKMVDSSKVSAIESEIDSDPYFSAVYETESGRNPQAANPNSTAKGAFQLISSTAKSLGVEDPLDIAQNFEGFKKLTEENRARFGNDPITLYKAHYLGAPLLKKVQQGKALNPQEQAIVRDLQARALPRFLKIYTRITGGEEV